MLSESRSRSESSFDGTQAALSRLTDRLPTIASAGIFPPTKRVDDCQQSLTTPEVQSMMEKVDSISALLENMRMDLLKECQHTMDTVSAWTDQLSMHLSGQRKSTENETANHHILRLELPPTNVTGAPAPSNGSPQVDGVKKVSLPERAMWDFDGGRSSALMAQQSTGGSTPVPIRVLRSAPESCSPVRILRSAHDSCLSPSPRHGSRGRGLSSARDSSTPREIIGRVHSSARDSGARPVSSAAYSHHAHTDRMSMVTCESDATQARKVVERDVKKKQLWNSYHNEKQTQKDNANEFMKVMSVAGLDSFRVWRYAHPSMDKRPRCRPLENFVHSTAFRCVAMLVIVLSTFHVGITEYDDVGRMKKRYWEQGDIQDYPPHRQAVAFDWCFVSFFWIELLMRSIVEQEKFLFGRMMLWNLLDVLVATSYLLEASLATAGADLPNGYPWLVVFRALRPLRALRSFKESRRMLLSILHSVKPFFWVFSFLALLIFMFAVPIQQAVVRRLGISYADDEVIQDLEPFFLSFSRTYISLFKAITGGDDWGQMMDALASIHYLYAVFFFCYISIMVFCVCNIITGIFVDAATQLASKDRDLMRQLDAEKTAEAMRELTALFEEIDEGQTGTIAASEFAEAVKRQEVIAVFNHLGVSNPGMIFRILDVDESGHLEIDEFVMGCLNLRGDASRADIEILVRENQTLFRKLRKFSRVAMENLFRLEIAVEDIHAMMTSRTHDVWAKIPEGGRKL